MVSIDQREKKLEREPVGKCVCGELPEERPAKKGFNTIAYQMGKGQGNAIISEDTQLEDKWGKHFISVDIKERQIKTTVPCFLKQQRMAAPSYQWCCETRTQMDPGENTICEIHLKQIYL